MGRKRKYSKKANDQTVKDKQQQGAGVRTRLTGPLKGNISFDEMLDKAEGRTQVRSPKKRKKSVDEAAAAQTVSETISSQISANNNAVPAGTGNPTVQSVRRVLDLEQQNGGLQDSSKSSSKQAEKRSSNPDIVTEVQLQTEEDDFDAEDSSDEESEGSKKQPRQSRKLMVERTTFPARKPVTTQGSEEDEIVMKEIRENPGLWSMVNRMVNRAEKVNSEPPQEQPKGKQGKNSTRNPNVSPNITPTRKSTSETTVYSPALRQRVLSGPTYADVHVPKPNTPPNPVTEEQITKILGQVRLGVASTSGATKQQDQTAQDDDRANDPREIARKQVEEAILDAEKNRATISAPQGKGTRVPSASVNDVAFIDGQASHFTCHLDDAMILKIQNGEFVELEKLLPKPKFYKGEDKRMDVIANNGQPYLVPVSERENYNRITNVRRWDDAFRVYTAVFSQANPSRGHELIEYLHQIHQAASSFVWDNVMYYDYCFRQNQGKFPQRNWSICNTHLWSMSMRDHLPPKPHQVSGQAGHGSRGPNPRDIYCWKYNRNKCTRGPDCKYEHKCSYCGSPQHIFYTCPKRNKANTNSANKQAQKPATEGESSKPPTTQTN